MSSLYRCRARVAYKPFKSDRVVVFEERQIQDLSVKLKGINTFSSANSQGNTSGQSYTSGLSQSKCQVTLSDPYLTGIAWPALFDAASMWSASNTMQTNNIIMRPCGEGEDPIKDKCYPYSSIDDQSLSSSADSSRPLKDTYAHIIISLWYDVNGTAFGTDYYFKVNRISINHGSNFPSVTLSGTDPRAVVFNQNLINVKFDEGMTVEEALKKIAEESGYKASFCVPPGGSANSPYTIPRQLIYKGVTPDEAMKRIIGATGGSMLSLPIKEYGNRVSVCSRGEITGSCTVFYLGKGLYEAYTIDGEPPVTWGQNNTQTGATINDADPYVSASFASEKYSLKEVIKEKRIKALEKVKKVTFPDLFKPCEKRCQGPRSDGYGWAGSNSPVENKRYTKVNLYGIAPNGTSAISYLPGKVESASQEEGRVVIKTEMWFQVCKDDKSEKCFSRWIYQESTNLSEVKIKNGDEVKPSQPIGSSTSDKKELTRFYINGHDNSEVTIDPQLIWNFAAPLETVSDVRNKNAPTGPGNNVVNPAPKQSLKDWKATTTAKPSKVLLMAGHADFPSGAPNERELNIELVKWAQRNAQAYGISDYIEVYLPSSSNIPENDPRSQFSKTSQAAGAGKQIIEIHNDETNGHSGVIPPTAGKRIWQLDDALSSSYGSFSVNHRDGLGVPKRGGTILEVGRMSPDVQRIVTSGSTAQKEGLYKQLMDPLMRSIAQEKARNAGTATPSPQPTQGSNESGGSGGFDGFVGRVGSTGRSTGPHVHIQESTSSTLTEAQLKELAGKYVTVSGKSLTSYTQGDGFGAGRNHGGLDFPIKEGEPIRITGQVVAAGPGVGGGDCGNGVAFKPPEGPELLICHMQDRSIPPNLPGLTSSASSGKGSPTVSSAPSNKALNIETSFKGVPRALRITPGRTILSFITDYDTWLDNNGHKGGDNSTDPGIWIPNKFRNWFINEAEFLWKQGDLRVNLQAANPWGNAVISAPKFSEYLSGQKKAGEFEKTNDYYGYIRSVGDLCFPVKNAKGELTSSCKELCKEAQEFYKKYGSGSDGQESGDPEGSFPAANCRTGDATKDAIINALYSAGMKTPNAFAGVLGNMQKESGINFDVHNGPRPGSGCSNTPSNVLGSVGYGLVQWCGSRADDLANRYKCGRNCSLNQQLAFLKSELEAGYKGMISQMNSAKSAGDAAIIFRREFERPSAADSQDRRDAAEAIVKQINCAR